METILYDYHRSSAAYRVRIALNIKGITVEQRSINLMPGVDEQLSNDYKELNPQGRVPLFVESEVESEVESNFRLGQSPAILEYLEETYPSPALLPTDPKDKAFVRQVAALIGCDIHPLNNLSILKYIKAEFGADAAAVQKWYSHWILEGFSAIETLLTTNNKTGKFCFGDTPSLADLYLVPQVYNARRFSVDLDSFPTIMRIDKECQMLSAFSKAAPEAQTTS